MMNSQGSASTLLIDMTPPGENRGGKRKSSQGTETFSNSQQSFNNDPLFPESQLLHNPVASGGKGNPQSPTRKDAFEDVAHGKPKAAKMSGGHSFSSGSSTEVPQKYTKVPEKYAKAGRDVDVDGDSIGSCGTGDSTRRCT